MVTTGTTLPSTSAVACSCATTSAAENFERADAVFIGEVTGRREPWRRESGLTVIDPAVYVVEVSRVYKGTATTTQEVSTPVNGASCGLELPSRGTALFYTTASPPTDVVPGHLTSTLCSGTAPVRAAPSVLGAGRPPLGSSSSLRDSPVALHFLGRFLALA